MANGIRRRRRWAKAVVLVGLAAGALLTAGGCAEKPQKPRPRWTELPPVQVPEFLKGTIYEAAELQNTEPFVVSGFGLVVHLRGTGDSKVPGAVRDYMIKEMVRRGFGTNTYVPEYKDYTPERMLLDPSVAIVQVDAMIPPGARARQRIDVAASALEGNATSSLAHGRLYQCDLKIMGANRMNPAGSVNAYVRTNEGQIYVNPYYAVNGTPDSARARASLRQGLVMDGGVVLHDRPLTLRLRRPQYSLSRSIEMRLDYLFQQTGENVSSAKDEAIIQLIVPEQYHGDWEHFAAVVMHTYINSNVGFLTAKARELAAEAVKPDAKLADISYCWESIGTPALQFVQPLMTHRDPAVAYAAARAAAFIGDSPAQTVLLQMAATPDHPFQVNAVQTLGALSKTPAVGAMLRQILDTSQPLVRLEAYRLLVRQGHPSIITMDIGGKFKVDYVPCAGPPMIYATRTGVPRIAVFGDRASLALPVTFTAMNNAFSVSSADNSAVLTLFYRGADQRRPVKQLCRPDLIEMIARLGGEVGDGENRFDFSYGDVIGILEGLSSARKIHAAYHQERAAVALMLQELPGQEDRLHGAAVADRDDRDPRQLPELPVADPKSPRKEPGGGTARPQ